jgi:hypothetical protein
MSVVIPRKTRLGVRVRKRNGSKFKVSSFGRRQQNNITTEPHMIDSEYHRSFVESMFAVRGKTIMKPTNKVKIK